MCMCVCVCVCVCVCLFFFLFSLSLLFSSLPLLFSSPCSSLHTVSTSCCLETRAQLCQWHAAAILGAGSHRQALERRRQVGESFPYRQKQNKNHVSLNDTHTRNAYRQANQDMTRPLQQLCLWFDHWLNAHEREMDAYSSFRSCLNFSSASFMRPSTSFLGRLKFSILKAYTVTMCTPRSRHHSSVCDFAEAVRQGERRGREGLKTLNKSIQTGNSGDQSNSKW